MHTLWNKLLTYFCPFNRLYHLLNFTFTKLTCMQDNFQFFQPGAQGLRSLISKFFYIRSSSPDFLQEQMVLPYPQLTLGFFLKSHFAVSKSKLDQTLVQKYVFFAAH